MINDMDRNERLQSQLERLQSTLNRAFRNVPFHQSRFRAAGIDPGEIGAVEDLAKLPFMRRGDLGDHYPYGLFAVPLRDIVRIHTAPGTSRNPSISGYTRQDLSVWQRIISDSLAAAGVTPNDILQIQLDPGLANWARDYRDGTETLGAGVIPGSQLSIEKRLMVLKDYMTTVLITTPAGALELAEYMYRNGIHPNGFNLRTLILVGEPAAAAEKRKLEEMLHVTTWQHYGLSEIPGPAIGFECGRHAGLHLHEDHIIAEITDPQTGAPVPDGETGELVLTTLTARAFPLIRFRTGDRARKIKEPCPCGDNRMRIDWLPERMDDLMIICGVKVDKQQIRDQIEGAFGPALPDYRFLKTSYNFRDLLEIRIRIDQRFFSDEIKDLEKIRSDTAERLTDNLGIPVSVVLCETV